VQNPGTARTTPPLSLSLTFFPAARVKGTTLVLSVALARDLFLRNNAVTLIHPSRSCSPNFPPESAVAADRYVARRGATFAKLVSSERQRLFRGVNCLCRTRVVKKQLPAATVFANRASADQRLSRVCIQWRPMENHRWPKKIITPLPFLAKRARSKSTSILLRALLIVHFYPSD